MSSGQGAPGGVSLVFARTDARPVAEPVPEVLMSVIEPEPTRAGLEQVMRLLEEFERVPWVAGERVVHAVRGDTAEMVYGAMERAQVRGGAGGKQMRWRWE